MITPQQVKELREKTGAGIMDCKNALTEADGDIEKAIVILRERGLAKAAKKQSRVATEGVIEAYVHGDGRIGVLVEVNCETDFVARNEEFRRFAKDIAMQVAASNPKYLSRDMVPADVINQEREIFRTQALNEGKPENIVDKIVDGKLEKFYEENCLLEQPFIKDPDKNISQLLTEKIALLGENIVISRFVRFEKGETLENTESGCCCS
ncbi:elongation factor Ts [Tepidanaerobacter syntrophicus]|uniref:Elongation factor Ts n=1 Tax=Tepidanaerobacter syntrophicus TaxID=224999 RepID=A0A0U9HH66_9FIRM|nr:translation elongation factor Ts [Tepidanaerobacter syntrophicus]GAQ26226.1 elongation factor Ts [Tepidanaerobacter syntrophicus]GLI19214.1 elongation factor Ts [Tepidanaerobacter syntrophicus]GLI50153.1 elongation factor Ts [Tepidanaerobacter syntrophicus]HHV83560.1 translation elongation factor Ts [Tepidanaerobacter syntrophicus]